MLRKHSISIRGHKTSYSLEDEFYAELNRAAKHRNISLASLVTQIDRYRAPQTNLSSALRLYVLGELKSS